MLGKALAQGLRPIVIINKVDRPDGRPDEVVDEVFDLFVSLDATSEQLDFPIMYASGRDGWCAAELDDPRENLTPLLDLVLQHVPPPMVEPDKPFAMLATLLDSDPYIGRCLTGRVLQGTAKMNAAVKSIDLDGKQIETGRLTKLLRFEGTKRVPVEEVQAGDLICIAGLTKTSVADTIGDPGITEALASTPIDPPTMSVNLTVNDSPFAGQEGKKVTSTVIRQRLLDEVETNVAITFAESENRDAFEIGGRGELQLGVLIETMRREGYELQVGQPQVLIKEINGKKCEPMEELTIDLPEIHSGTAVDAVTKRKGEMTNMVPKGDRMTIEFSVPSRGIIGLRNYLLTATAGEAIMTHRFVDYQPYKGEIPGRLNGSLISMELGTSIPFSLNNLQERGTFFIAPGESIYEGQVIGENSRASDLVVNVTKTKQLTNMRKSGTDAKVRIIPPRIFSLEESLEYIQRDEYVEVTPKTLRIRKVHLTEMDRKRAQKS